MRSLVVALALSLAAVGFAQEAAPKCEKGKCPKADAKAEACTKKAEGAKCACGDKCTCGEKCTCGDKCTCKEKK